MRESLATSFLLSLFRLPAFPAKLLRPAEMLRKLGNGILRKSVNSKNKRGYIHQCQCGICEISPESSCFGTQCSYRM
ncbi:hypothetical protein F4805DRAFT_448762 [Annulohypoxylon moriforme]|nr:hypothetical protein F4805DRAFT_448762 [Annulohypoxylon moriforme]